MAVVGVTSYSFDGPTVLAQGASILTRAFDALREVACSNQEGNC